MLTLVFLGLFGAAQLSVTEAVGCGRIVCYTTNWSQYRPEGGKFFPANIDPALCTHMIYAFAKLSGNNLAAFEWNDDSTPWSVGLFEKFQNLKKINPNVKTLLAVGGWNLGSAPFTQIVQSQSNRQAFITQAMKFLRDRDFDGLDLDWEYPANRGSPSEDKGRFTMFVHELKEAFDAEAASSGKPRLLLTAAVAAGKDNIDTAYEVPALSRDLDFINLMTYDLHGSWETHTGHNSPLYARSDETGAERHLNLDFAAKYWVQKGADPTKMNIGMGLYGRSFTLNSASNYQVGAPASKGGHAGRFTREAGFIAYYEVCDMIKAGGQVEMIPEQQVPFVHQGDQWVGYDNPDSLRMKVRYVKENNFGGVMVWALPLDDFSGNHCGQGPYPLMHAINDECGQTTGSLQTQAPVVSTARPTAGSGSESQSSTHSPGTTTEDPHVIHPTDQFTCGAQDGFYPSPYSCQEYFICASHISYTVRCAEGLVYNANTGYCDWPEHYHCNIGSTSDHVTSAHTTHAPRHTTTISGHVTHTQAPSHGAEASTTPPFVHMTTTTTESTGGHTSIVDVQNFCHGHADGIFADPTNCKNFIECANGHTYLETCSPGTAWHDEISTCDLIDNVPGCQ